MRTKGSRLAKLEASAVELVERWVVSPVSQPILAAGKLLKQGWRLVDVEESGLCLVSPGHEAQICLRFNNNTLVCSGVVRAISEPPAPSAVRAVTVKLSGLLDRLLATADFFQEIAPGVFATTLTSRCHVDLGLYLPYEGLSYRTTLFKVDGEWALSEMSTSLENVGDDLTQEVADQEVKMIVFGYREPLSPEELGFTTAAQASDSPVPVPCVRPASPRPDDPLVDDLVVRWKESKLKNWPGARRAEPRNTIIVDDVDPSLESTLSTLRRACQCLGVGKSGSKAVVFKRLCDRLDKLRLLEASWPWRSQVPLLLSCHLRPRNQRRAHNAVHAPYAPWCAYCVAHKARDDAHKRADADRRIPVASFDYGFTNCSEKDGLKDKLAFLCVHDSESGWREAIPVPGKAGIHGSINVTSYLAAELCRLVSMLGHSKVVLQCDPEPTCLKLRNEVKRMRMQLGLQTNVQQTPEERHQSNGGAEVTVKTVRQQCNTLLAMYEAETKCEVGTFHALHSWAATFVHPGGSDGTTDDPDPAEGRRLAALCRNTQASGRPTPAQDGRIFLLEIGNRGEDAQELHRAFSKLCHSS